MNVSNWTRKGQIMKSAVVTAPATNDLSSIFVIEDWSDKKKEDKTAKILADNLGIALPEVNNKNEKFFIYDEQAKSLQTEDSLQEYLLFRRQHDYRVKPQTWSVRVVGVPHDQPLTHGQVRKDNKLFQDMIDDDNIIEAGLDNGLVIVHPKESGKDQEAHRLMYTGYSGLCRAAGIYGASLSRVIPTKGRGVLPADERGKIFTDCLRLLESDRINLLVRDGAVAHIGSSSYQALDAAEGYLAFKDYLDKQYPDNVYAGGEVSEEYLMYKFDTNTDTTDLEEKLEGFGVDIGNGVSLRLRYTTSDVGNSAMRVVPILTINNMDIVMNDGVNVRHDIGNTIWDKDLHLKGRVSLEGQLPKLANSLDEMEDAIEALGNIDIKYVTGSFVRAAKTLTGLNKETVEAEKKDMLLTGDFEGTGIDVYIAINRAIVRQCTDGSDFNVSKYVELTEAATKFLYENFARYDKLVDED